MQEMRRKMTITFLASLSLTHSFIRTIEVRMKLYLRSTKESLMLTALVQFVTG